MIDLPGASENLRELAARGVRKRYAERTRLIQEGDLGNTLFIVIRGRLRVFSADEDAGRAITYGTYGPGEYVGEMSLDGEPRSASVETLEPSQCVMVTRRTLDAFIEERPSFAFELLAKVIARARAATLSARDMALNDVYGRLRLLLETASAVRSDDGARVFSECLTHKAIAHRIGCSPGMVTRQIKDLERGGYLAREGKSFLLLRPLPVRW